jgi:alcohol dehydrogenase class IV
MQQYNFPTIIYCGQGAIEVFAKTVESKGHRCALIVTDRTLEEVGLLQKLTDRLDAHGINYAVFADVHPNPTDEDVEKGVIVFKKNHCDSLIALGGGSPMDAAKTIKIMAVHPGPLSQYDDAGGGDRLINRPMPPLYAIPTTAGTGSEVGRSAVIVMRESGRKTIYFHPSLMPDLAVLEPEFTAGLPAHITAASGVDAFTHSLEAYFAPDFHPMADGIALEGMALVLDWLPAAVKDGGNLLARERMLLAAAMGATAFQKGLGMIHSLAHPLSTQFEMHHGLANALMLPFGVRFLEDADLTDEQTDRIARVQTMFEGREMAGVSLSESCERFVSDLGIELGLSNHGVAEKDLDGLAEEAVSDPCHPFNMIPVTQDDLLAVYRTAL